MKVLLGAVLILVLVWVVAGKSLSSVTPIVNEMNEADGRKRIGYSPNHITFRDQYLCYAAENYEWVMRPDQGGDDCQGPFFDSVNLCRALGEQGQSRVQLYWEGRVLECPE